MFVCKYWVLIDDRFWYWFVFRICIGVVVVGVVMVVLLINGVIVVVGIVGVVVICWDCGL